MRVTIYLSDGSVLDFSHFDMESALDLRAGLDENRFQTFEMDDATVLVNSDHIVRIDFDEPAASPGQVTP